MIKAFFITCLFLIPMSDKVNVFVNEEQKYSISYPETWEHYDNSGAALFLSPLDNETDSFRENVNVIVQDLSNHAMTLKQYTELSTGQLKSMLGIEKFESIKDIKHTKIAAKEVIYDMPKNIAAGIPKDLKLKQIWFVHSSKAYLLTYTAEKGTYDRYLEQANACLLSFTLKK